MSDDAKPRGYAEMSAEVRRLAHTLAVEIMLGMPDSMAGMHTQQHVVVTLLRQAFFDAIRDEWYHTVKAGGLELSLALAQKMMKDDQFGTGDVICSPFPGPFKPMVATVDSKEYPCFELSIPPMVPLSAIYTDRIRKALEISERLAKLSAEDTNDGGARPTGGGDDPRAPQGAPDGDA